MLLYYTSVESKTQHSAFPNVNSMHPITPPKPNLSRYLGHIPHLPLPKRTHPHLPRLSHPLFPQLHRPSHILVSSVHQRTLSLDLHDVGVIRCAHGARVFETEVFGEGEAEDGGVVLGLLFWLDFHSQFVK